MFQQRDQGRNRLPRFLTMPAEQVQGFFPRLKPLHRIQEQHQRL